MGWRGEGGRELEQAQDSVKLQVDMYSCDLMMSCLCSPGGDDRGGLTQFKEGMAKVGSKVTKMELVTSAWFKSITVYSLLLWV